MHNYLYNGVELPELPNWDKEAYPKALIYKVDATSATPDFTRIICYSADPEHTGYGGDDSDDIVLFDFPALFYELDESSNTWVFKGHSDVIYEGNTGIWITDTDMIWSNTDIIVEATIFGEHMKVEFLASDPVPVTVLTARDLYKVINGKPTKLTLYKKLGGKLIPLDEHTKEVKT